MKLIPSWIVVLAWLACNLASADDALQGDIRFQPAREGTTWVGQELELQLELWSDGLSFGNQLFVLPEVKGAYLLQADSSTVKLNESRGGVPWQGLRYTFLLYPQVEGPLEVPAFDVGFTSSAGFGAPVSAFEFQTRPLMIEARLPPGTESGRLLVTTASFEMETSWKPQPGKDNTVQLKVGDAITLSLSRSAADVPGMVFTPLPDLLIDGLGIYPGTPQVDDQVNRGSLTGTRTETITFVCEREGVFEIPEMRFQWWDPERELLQEKIITALSLDVAAHPAYSAGTAAPGTAAGRAVNVKVAVTVMLLIFLLSVFWFRWRKLLSGKLQQRRLEREAGEPWAFRWVTVACRSGTATEAYNAITLWLSRCDQPSGLSLLRLARDSGNEALVRQVRALQDSVIEGSASEWNGSELARLLAGLRNGPGQHSGDESELQELNPPA
jgi:hypothetical protein